MVDIDISTNASNKYIFQNICIMYNFLERRRRKVTGELRKWAMELMLLGRSLKPYTSNDLIFSELFCTMFDLSTQK